MLDWMSSIPLIGNLGGTVHAYIMSGIVMAILGGFGKFLPREKVAGWINSLSALLDGVVDKVSDVLVTPVEMAGATLSKLLLAKLCKSATEKLEEGMFVTLADWLTEALNLVQSFVNQILGIVVKLPARFKKGLLKDNAK